MKKSRINLIYVVSIFMVILFAIASINLFSASEKITNADTLQSNEDFYIDVYDRDGSLLYTEDVTSFNGYNAFIYQWEDSKDMILNFDPTKGNVPVKDFDVNNVETYKLVVEIQYIQGYYENISWSNYSTLLLCEKTETGLNSYLNFKDFNYIFDIDKGISGKYNNKNITIGTWGVYRFRYTINGYEMAISDFFVIEPTIEVLEAPKITYKTTPSQVTLHSAYNFSLKNKDKYKYIDKSKLIWYALGKATDGTTYSLTFTDINSGKKDFQNCSTALYETWTRTGQTFYFDDNGIAGDWEIWCEYNYSTNENLTLKSNIQKIKTGKALQFSSVIWILLGVFAVSIGISIGICAYKIKRERIY